MPERDLILVLTSVVVAFSILVQGLTIGPLMRRWLALEHLPTRIDGQTGHGEAHLQPNRARSSRS